MGLCCMQSYIHTHKSYFVSTVARPQTLESEPQNEIVKLVLLSDTHQLITASVTVQNRKATLVAS
jgi:hypothetical protein